MHPLRAFLALAIAASAVPARLSFAQEGVHAPSPADLGKVSREMAAAAQKFLDCLSPEQLATAGFEFKDNERFNWHFIPKPRKGLTLKDMSADQQALAKALLKTGLSDSGMNKALTIMSLEQILHDVESKEGKGPRRDVELYYWSIFGKPGAKQAWGWRVEGHHISLNFTVLGDKAAIGGPAFLGSNPAEVKEGERKGLRVLGEEEDQGRALARALNPAQLKKAMIATLAPKDIVTGAKRTAILKDFQGIPASELDESQKSVLMNLVSLYAHRLRKELAEDDLNRIAHAGLGKIYFAWAGSLEPGQGHYYRIHGTTFLIEYDNTQNNANHIHSVWRDLENDFGGDALQRHYETSPHHQH